MGGYFVWAGGRWCEVDAASGRVQGWRRRARFVYRSRGRLRVASTAAVLRGLQALLAGRPGSVRDGAPLSQRRCKKPSLSKKTVCAVCQHHCYGPKHNTSSTNNNTDVPVKVEAGVQVTLPSRSQTSPTRAAPPPRPPPAPRSKRKRSASSEPHVIKYQVRVDVHRSSGDEAQPKTTQDSELPLAQKHSQSQKYHSNEPSQQQSHCKELVINEEDVDLYRLYLIKHDPDFDVYRFDSDENYKLKVFFRINPLVNIERCARIERMLRVSQSSQEMSLKDFATKLGLRSISDPEDTHARYKMRSRAEKIVHELSSDEETDKENHMTRAKKDYLLNLKARAKVFAEEKNQIGPKTRKKLYSDTLLTRNKLVPVEQNKKKNVIEKEHTTSKSAKETDDDDKVGASSTTSDSEFVKKTLPAVKKTVTVKKSTIKPPVPAIVKRKRTASSANSYSSLEDHAIVAWVSCGARARQVNGNRVWRELQPQYPRLAGRSRTWHSLRNRYLRYILPALPALALPPPHAARLRAAAAAGELKTKSRCARRNSIFSQPPVRSAAAALRPRPRLTPQEASDVSDCQTSGRVLRSSAAHESPAARGDKRLRAPRSGKRIGDSDSESEHERDNKRSRIDRGDSTDEDQGHSERAGRSKLTERLKEQSNSSSKSSVTLDRLANGRFKPRGRSEGKTSRNRSHASDSRDASDDSRVRSRDGLAKFLNRSDRSELRGRAERGNRSDDRHDDRRASLRQRREKSEDRRSSLRSRREGRPGEARTPTYEQLTRQFASRLRSTPLEQAARPNSRTRKLYNPSAMLL